MLQFERSTLPIRRRVFTCDEYYTAKINQDKSIILLCRRHS